ncbi:hypothetical protein RJ55_03820 [Drechmeria coniospora]|nr:hypothetical protein RJ55_03820 [Drechmeria coniospora]
MARIFSTDILNAVPRYLPSPRSQPETSTNNIRYGKDGATYVCDLEIASKGAHASVMKVKDNKSGRTFGAKEPHYKISDDHDAARRLFEDMKREYEYIIQLDHPHIVKAYELVLAENVRLPPWLIVEYIPRNLLETIDDLVEGDKPVVLTHLSSALHHMHSCGITHRDVKPDNALVQTRGRELIIKLADFGTSKHNATGNMDSFTGTEIYMAPELFEIPRRYSNKVDMWSLGIIALQLFTAWDPTSDGKWDGPWELWTLDTQKSGLPSRDGGTDIAPSISEGAIP